MSRRMISTEIVESDAFLEMPASSQALYLHLVLNADDDGVVASPMKVRRMCGGTSKDLRRLLDDRFILQVGRSIVIKHWFMQNALRKDRYKPSQYSEITAKLRIKDNGAYTLDEKKGQPFGNHLATNWQPTGNQLATNWQPMVAPSKDKLSKDNINNARARAKNTFSDFPQRVYSDEDLTEMEKMKRRK